MKRVRILTAIALVVFVSACSKNDNPTPDPPVPPVQDTDLRGKISSDMKLTKDKTWTLRGYVYVTNGAILTIEPGTKIISKKDSAGVLIITTGAKINAKGTAGDPIVFTSGEDNPFPGDLGGVVLMGKATSNGNHSKAEGGLLPEFASFGGTDDADNSGVLSYVRIEYGGKAVNPNDEVNGLSLYAVGNGTTIDHIQVVRGQDDAFEFFGGSVNCKYLIAYNCADDDFDMDDGFHGSIQFGLSVKDPKFTDNKTGGDFSNNIECDNTNGKSFPYTKTPVTRPLLSNLTLIGPGKASGVDGTLDTYGYGNRWRRGAQFGLVNSVIIGGQKAGLSIESTESGVAFLDGTSLFKNNYVQALENVFQLGSDVSVAGLDTVKMRQIAQASGSKVVADLSILKLKDAFNDAKPDAKPETGSPLLTGASFDGDFDNSNFQKVNYVGAFGTEDWTTGWTVWGK